MSKGSNDLSTADLAGQQPAETILGEPMEKDVVHDGPREEDRPMERGLGDHPGQADRDDDAEAAPSDAEHQYGRQRLAHPPPAEEVSPTGTDSNLVEHSGGASVASPATRPEGPLLSSMDGEGFRARWTDIQTTFVDAPRKSVEQADALVAELMQHLATTFAEERGRLEHQWDQDGDVPTDDLRAAFQRYRSFFERLLAT